MSHIVFAKEGKTKGDDEEEDGKNTKTESSKEELPMFCVNLCEPN